MKLWSKLLINIFINLLNLYVSIIQVSSTSTQNGHAAF